MALLQSVCMCVREIGSRVGLTFCCSLLLLFDWQEGQSTTAEQLHVDGHANNHMCI